MASNTDVRCVCPGDGYASNGGHRVGCPAWQEPKEKPRTTVKTDCCGICRQHRVRTVAGKLFALAIRGPKRDYVRYICEDCVGLFNTTQWPKTSNVLRGRRKDES